MKLWLRWIWCVLFQKIQSVAYLQRSDALPHPLQKHQEAELLKKMKDGDMNARDVLIEHNLRLVVYIAKRYETNPVMMEDLISIGTIGLIKAVASFDSEKNIKLVTYASRCIENEILMFLRKKNRRKQEVSFDEPLNVDYDGNEREEDFYFNINKSELIKLQTSVPGGLEQLLKNIIGSKDGNKIMEMFAKVIHLAYGEKSPDGKRFVKSEEISEAFEQTLAYDQLFRELVTDADKASAFVKAILPADMETAENVKVMPK